MYSAMCVCARMKEVYIFCRYIYSMRSMKFQFFISNFFSSLPIRERRKALSLRGVLTCPLRDGQHHKNGETTTRLFFEEKDASSSLLLPAPVFRGKARDARSRPSFGGVVVFFVRVFYLSSLFAMGSRCLDPIPQRREREEEEHHTTVFFDGTRDTTIYVCISFSLITVWNNARRKEERERSVYRKRRQGKRARIYVTN